MSFAKNQHWIPRFYLNHFSKSKKTHKISCADRDLRPPFSTKRIASANDYYVLRDPMNVDNIVHESETLLGRVETHASQAIIRISQQHALMGQPRESDYYGLLFFVAVQILRSDFNRRLAKSDLEKTISENSVKFPYLAEKERRGLDEAIEGMVKSQHLFEMHSGIEPLARKLSYWDWEFFHFDEPSLLTSDIVVTPADLSSGLLDFSRFDTRASLYNRIQVSEGLIFPMDRNTVALAIPGLPDGRDGLRSVFHAKSDGRLSAIVNDQIIRNADDFLICHPDDLHLIPDDFKTGRGWPDGTR